MGSKLGRELSLDGAALHGLKTGFNVLLTGAIRTMREKTVEISTQPARLTDGTNAAFNALDILRTEGNEFSAQPPHIQFMCNAVDADCSRFHMARQEDVSTARGAEDGGESA